MIKYQKPNGVIIEINENHVNFAKELGWKVIDEIETKKEPTESAIKYEKIHLPLKKIKRKASQKKPASIS
jgi:hypothetical protein